MTRATFSEAWDEDLRAAAHARSLAHLAPGTAHDVNAALNALLMNLELLGQSLETDAPGAQARARERRCAKVLDAELARLSGLLDPLLSHLTRRRPEREHVDLDESLRRLQTLIAPQARFQRVALDVRSNGAELLVAGHSDQLEQALLTLLINALQVMPEGGELSVTARRAEGKVRIRVADTGPGIPAPLMERIFEAHFTTLQSGTGIGLYVARRVIERHGGAITASSDPGRGASFDVELPAAKLD